MAAVARATYNLYVSWGAYNVGLLSFDHSLFDGTDVFGTSPLDATFGGTYDDVSKLHAGATITRGRSNNTDVVLAGSANIDLRDPTGIYNPDNASGPLYGQLEDRLHPVKLTATYAGTTYGKFYGWVRRFHWEPSGRNGITRLECVDLFYWLDRANPVISSTGPTSTGAAVGKILDAIGATDSGMRDLDVGDSIPDFSADGSKTALELIQGLLEAERGVFFIAGTGKATYRSRLSRLTGTTSTVSSTYGSGTYGGGSYGGTAGTLPTITDLMSGGDPGVDWDQVYDRITVQRVDATGTVLYTATAFSSVVVAKVGYNDMPTIQTTYLSSNAQADGLASWILAQNVSPKPPMRDFTIDNRDTGLLTQILTRELVDRITVSAGRGNTSGDFNIDSITETIDGKTGRHTAAWLLSKASTVSPVLFDTALFDAAYQFVY